MFKVLNYIIAICIVLNTYHVEAQISEIDSLRNQLRSLTLPEEIGQTYNALAWVYRDFRPDSMLYFTNQTLYLAREHSLTDLEQDIMSD